MPDLSAEVEAATRRLGDNLAGDRLPRETARLYSQHVRLRAGADPLDGFTDNDATSQLWDAVRLIEAARFSRVRGEIGWSPMLRRAGELLEWLAHPETNQSGYPLHQLGAAAYQLAGYPARAASLARAATDSSADLPIVRELFSGDLNGVLLASSRSAQRATSPPEPVRTEDVEGIIDGYVASALGVLAACLRWSDPGRLSESQEILRLASDAALRFSDPFSWLTLRLATEGAAEIVRTSLRAALEPLTSQLPADGRAAFERYARLAFRAGQFQVWPSQQRGIDSLVEGGSFALCTPTGSGKTRIAEIALLQGLLARDVPDEAAPVCLYIVPTRALAAEVESKLNGALREASTAHAVTITGLYGGIDWGPTDQWLSGDEPTVLICTPEKAEALVRFAGRALTTRLREVIIDEAHGVQFTGGYADLEAHEDRSLRLETLVTRLKVARPDVRFIAVSAVAQDISRPLSQWISSDTRQDAVTVPYRSTRQVIGRLHCFSSGQTRIEYDVLDGSPVRIDDQATAPFVPRPLPEMPATPELGGPMQRAAVVALWAAIHYANGQSGRGQTVLVSVVEQIGNHAAWWLKALEELWTDEDLPHYFEPPAEGPQAELWDRANAACLDLFGSTSREYRLLQHGIVMHHSRMPGRLPRYIRELVESQTVRIVIATSGLSEGINLPFETVLVPGLRRHNSNTRMSGHEFANLAGRAGRPGIATEGQVLSILLGGGVSRDYASIARELVRSTGSSGAPASALAVLVQRVRALYPVDDDASFTAWLESTAPAEVAVNDENERLLAAMDSLDAVALAALEDGGDASHEDALQRFWRASFAHFASNEEERLQEMFALRGRALAEHIYPDAAARSRIYRTTLPPRGAMTLIATAPELVSHLETGTEYARWEPEERLRYILRAIDIVGAVSAFHVPANVGKSKATREDALRWWMQVPTEDSRQPGVSQVSQWHKFLQSEVRYRFTWGLGAALAVSTEQSADPLDAPVPPAALWIKDLLTWGTLDPVEAFLLSRGFAHTRPDAYELANEYYEDIEPGSEADPFDVASLTLWAARRFPNPEPERLDYRIAVDVVERMTSEQRGRTYRVLPVGTPGDGVVWVDPSGTELARSHEEVALPDAREHDFVLTPEQGFVEARTYV